MDEVPRAIAAAVAVLFSACCGLSPAAVRPASPTPVAVITEADAGRTLQLHVGEQVALRLSTTMVWSAPQSSGGAVRVTPSATTGGYHEWIIVGAARGAATVTAQGRPPCSPGTMCTQVIREFAVDVVVS